MRFTPSTNWSIANSAAYRKVAFTTEVRIVTDLDDALFSGTWTRIDSMIHRIDDIRQSIEYNPGQFRADSITVTVGNISWWNTNFLNTSNYIEFRRTVSIGIGTAMMSTDQACVFHGFIDNREEQLSYSNETDEVTFTVYTTDDIGSRISALNVNTQYYNGNIDGAGKAGLILPKISGIYVEDANIASYVLKKGFHKLTYRYNGGAPQMKLDDGDYVGITGDASNILINKSGDEKIKVYAVDDQLSTLAEVEDYVIVITAGTTLPRQPYYGISAGYILRKLYEQIGYTAENVTIDTLQYTERDSIARHSYYDIPPQDINKTGEIKAVTNNGTDLFIGVGDSVYKRTMSNDSYTLITTKTNYTVKRLWYSSRTNELWIWFDGASDKYVRLYYLDTSTYDEANVTSNADYRSADVIDYNYTGSSYKYGMVYTNKSGAGDVRYLDGDNFLTDTQLFIYSDFGYAVGGGAASQYLFVDDNKVYFAASTDVDPFDYAQKRYYQISVNSSGTWVNDGQLFSGVMDDYYHHTTDEEINAACHLTENRIYFVLDGSPNVIKSHLVTERLATTVITLSAGYRVDTLHYANGVVYAKVRKSSANNESVLYSISSNTATLINQDSGIAQTYYETMTYMNNVLYGVDYNRRLWRYSPTLQMYYKHTVWEDISIRDAINECLAAYNLIGKISSQKKVYVYRRGNDSGTKQNTGNAITITRSNCSKITKIENAYPKITWVEVSNDEETHSYDGTNYDTAVLSDAKTFKLSNPLIPTERIKDVAKYIFAFWSIERSTYQYEMRGAPMEMEIMDLANQQISSGYISGTLNNGLIISQAIDGYGRVIFEVLY